MNKFRIVLDRPGEAPTDEYGNPAKTLQTFAPSLGQARGQVKTLLAGQTVGTTWRVYEIVEQLVDAGEKGADEKQ